MTYLILSIIALVNLCLWLWEEKRNKVLKEHIKLLESRISYQRAKIRHLEAQMLTAEKKARRYYDEYAIAAKFRDGITMLAQHFLEERDRKIAWLTGILRKHLPKKVSLYKEFSKKNKRHG